MVGFSIKVYRDQRGAYHYQVYRHAHLIAADAGFRTASAARNRAECWVFAYRAAYAA